MTHSTDYVDTFIEVADDTPAIVGTVPPAAATPTIAGLHFALLSDPYSMTSDEALFETFARRRDISAADREAAKAEFFSRGQPCLRSSPLGKRYGWGIHFDDRGRVGLYPVESAEYRRLADDPSLVHLRAMRSRRV